MCSTVSHNLLLGIDLGTSGVKVGAFDTDGRQLVRASHGYATSVPRPGWAEQDPDMWWSSSACAIRTVMEQVKATRVQALCVTGLAPAMVCTDRRGRPVRHAPIWSDWRAKEESEELQDALGSNRFSTLLPLALWMKRKEPSSYRETRCIFQSYEYLAYKLTGKATSIVVRPDRLPRAPEAIAVSGLDPHKFPEEIVRTGEVYGALSSEIARQLGLTCGTPVIAGTVDSFSSWIGIAADHAGVLCDELGTSSRVSLVCEHAIPTKRDSLGAIPHLNGRDWVIAAAMSCGGVTLDWFVREFYPGEERPFEKLVSDAASVPEGAGGLVFLPYLNGERAPMRDPQARGVIYGIAAHHTRAHFARAILESLAFAVRDVCEVFKDAGGKIEQARIAGPSGRNRLLNQIKADVLDVEVLVPENTDSSLLGAAMLASWGSGIHGTIEQAVESMSDVQSVLTPEKEKIEIYEQSFRMYRKIYSQLKSSFAASTQLLH